MSYHLEATFIKSADVQMFKKTKATYLVAMFGIEVNRPQRLLCLLCPVPDTDTL